MAKKRATRGQDKQAYIEGTEPPKPPAHVAKLRDDFLTNRKKANALKTKVGEISDQLILAMKEAKIERLWNEEAGNWLKLDEKFKLVTEAKAKDD